MDEIKKIWEKDIKIDKSRRPKPAGLQGQFLRAAKSKKMFWQILKELELDAYHGFLILEKLIESDCVQAPVEDMLLV